MALGRSIEFTVVPYPEFERNEQQLRIRDKIHGSEAMDELLGLMQTVHETNPAMDGSYLGYFTTWHDTFLRSYVKQRLNNVWLYIITFPESVRLSLAKSILPGHTPANPRHVQIVRPHTGNHTHTCAQALTSLEHVLDVPQWCNTETTHIQKKRQW